MLPLIPPSLSAEHARRRRIASPSGFLGALCVVLAGLLSTGARAEQARGASLLMAQAAPAAQTLPPPAPATPATAPRAAPVVPATPAPISANTIAQVLAGISPPPGHPIVDRLVATPEWREHRDWSQARWTEVNRRLDAMRAWRDTELSIPEAPRRTLLYPFSGPDFLNADALFPTHPRMVFFSLERAGSLPDIARLDDAQFARMLADVRHALSDIFERNYFITSYMTTQLTKPQIRGTVPVIALMMVLTGHRIASIEPIDPFPALTAEYNAPPPPRPAPRPRDTGDAGQAVSAGSSTQPGQGGQATQGATVAPGGQADGAASGEAAVAKAEARPRPTPRPRVPMSAARISFSKAGGPMRTLEYYGLDATDKELRWYPQFLEMATSTCQPCTTLIKSASYLLHDQQFAGTRSAILKSSDIIVQDDTGVPLRFLRSAGFNVDLYGVYMVPIKPMTYATQPDLEVAYREAGSKVKPIDFPFGYHGKSGKSGLILARRKP